MKSKLALALAFSTLAFAGSGQKQEFTGVITDSMCAKDHKPMGIAPDAKCVRECVKHSSKYVLDTGNGMYKLSDQSTPERFAAQKVKVTGTLYQKTGIIAVESMEAAK